MPSEQNNESSSIIDSIVKLTKERVITDIMRGELDDHLKSRIAIISQKIPPSERNENEADLISAKIASNLTSPPLARSTLFYWTRKGKLTAYKIGRRVCYSKKQVIEALMSVKKYHPQL